MIKIEMQDGGVIMLELYADAAPVTVANFKRSRKARVLRRTYLSSRDKRIYDPGR